MKHSLLITFICLLNSFAFAQATVNAKEPWTQDQLLAPEKLAAIISDTKAKQPVIISVAPAAVIPGSIDIGPANDKANLEKLKTQLKSIPKDSDIVLYCGCCPFEKCPNVRPAFSLLNDMGFRNQKLLNITHNVKTDWIEKGYPTAKLK